MLTINKENNTTIISGVKGDIFIIPNRAAKIEDYFEAFRDKYHGIFERQAEMNGLDLDAGEYGVETWIVSKEDCHCSNMADHRPYITDPETGEDIPFCLVDGRTIIRSLIDGKEGDVKTVRLPISINGRYHDEPYNGILEIELTLKQKEYRYARFGNFEKVLQDVCR